MAFYVVITNILVGCRNLHLCSHCKHLNAHKLEASASLTKFPQIQQEHFAQYQLPSGSSWKKQGAKRGYRKPDKLKITEK